ncbi:MAG: acyl carrier protein [Deltaproteobacteria bacterium]
MDNVEVRNKMRAILADKLNVPLEKITPEASLRDDLGMDSFGAVEILFEIEDAFNVDVPQESVAGIRTFGDMLAFVEKMHASGGQGKTVLARKDNDVP